MAKPGEKIKVPIFIRRKGADAFRPALVAGGSLMAYKCLSLCDFFIVQQFFKLCHICLMLFENLRGLHFHIGIIRHLGEILHQEINILLDSPDGSFQCRIVDSVDAFLRSRAVLRVQNFVHDLLADACFRRGWRNCVNLTQFLRCGFLGSGHVLVVAVSTGFPMLYTVLLSNEELLLFRREVAPPQLTVFGYSMVTSAYKNPKIALMKPMIFLLDYSGFFLEFYMF